MPKYIVSGYISCSIVAEIEASSEADARKKADDLGTPIVHTDYHSNISDGDWHFNEFDDPPDDAVQHVELADDTETD
ncbi:MAG: hypothetical protein O7G84_13605 [Gammaproteobacteria bacterium]|nr:hypothetical protein [Gammaproteobacteria bacterium]